MDLVILAGSLGKGAAWTQGCIKSLLPLPARSTLLEGLIRRFDSPAIDQCIICTDGQKQQFVSQLGTFRSAFVHVDFFEDSVPLGTAGCLKACESKLRSDTVMLAGGSVWLDDDPQWMLEQHRSQKNALTVFCIKDQGWLSAGTRQRHLRPAGLFCCDRSVLDHIRRYGFQDLKEQLVPSLKRAGLRVGAIALRGSTREVCDASTYMHIIAQVLSEGRFVNDGFARIAPDIWCGRNVRIASHARLVGPVLLGHDCRIENGAVVVGPTMLGDDSHVGRNARLIRVVAPHCLRIKPGLSLTDRVLTAPAPCAPPASRSVSSASTSGAQSNWKWALLWPRKLATPTTAVATILFAAFIWAFWASIHNLWQFLQESADYSAGPLVPVAALYMVAAHGKRATPSYRFWWPGLAVFCLGLGTNILGYSYQSPSLENFGMITCALGLIASIVGKAVCAQAWFPLLFLFLLVPLPDRLHSALTAPFQSWASAIAATALQTMDLSAASVGSTVQAIASPAESGIGLRMMLAILIVTGVIAYAVERPFWQKVIVFLSSIFIALACDVMRLILSAWLIKGGYERLAQSLFQEGAAFIMMPLAIGLVLVEFWLLAALTASCAGVSAIVEVVDDRVQRSGSYSSG